MIKIQNVFSEPDVLVLNTDPTYRGAIDRKNLAAVRAVRANNLSRLGTLIDELQTLYEQVGENGTGSLLRETYHDLLMENVQQIASAIPL